MPSDPESGNQLAVASGDGGGNTPSKGVSKVPTGLNVCRAILLFFCLVTASLMIVFIVRMLWYNPFEPVFWAFIVVMILYWVFSAALVGVSMKVYLLRNEEEKVRTCSKESVLRELKRPEFWFFIVTLIISFSCMLLLLSFCLPESFFPSSGLQLRRIAGVTSDSAALWIRDPKIGDGEIRIEFRLNATNDAYNVSTTSTTLTSETDYSGWIRLSGLAPATAYEVRFSAYPNDTLSFKTSPLPGTPSKFSFYFGSCFLHNFPYFQEAPGFGYVLDTLKPDLFMFLGDFIYSDIPFFRGDDTETYKSLYRHALMNSHVERAFRAIPNYHMWDDHEIQNDFPDLRPSNAKRAGRASFDNAITFAWQRYLGGGNPISYPQKTWFNFDYGDVAFFFVDTRANRTSNKLPDNANKTVLGAEQKADLKAWLLAKNNTAKFKFVMSPLALTYDFPSTTDSWGGFKTERDEIFNFTRDNFVEGVAFFTGDSHFAYAVEIGGRPGGIKGGLYEFSASPISAFDFTLGGVILDPTFKPVAEREDEVLFETIGRRGPMSLLGHARVDTTKPNPELAVDFYDGTTLLYTITLNGTQLRHWASPN